MPITKRVGLIGAGKMGEAIISGLLRMKTATPDNLSASDADPKRRDHIRKTYGIPCHADNTHIVESSRVIILAVLPKDVAAALEEIKEMLTPDHLLISVAAGVTSKFITKAIGRDIPTIRAMPNNPCMVGAGMIALAYTPNVPIEGLQTAKDIFAPLGRVVVTEERHFDAITGLSASGPAYVYLIIEAMADAGLKVGIPKDLGLLLTAQTVYGSAKMVLETGEHPARLRDMVVTPGGTTIEGVVELEKAGIRAAFMSAVEKATQRAKELSQV